MLSLRVANRMVNSCAPLVARCKHTLPDLPYDYHELEPVISADIMKIHHGKHHQTYVNNLNMIEDKIAEAREKNNLSAVINLTGAYAFNAGGHINHSIFWQNLSPQGGGEPDGELMDYIKRDFGSFENMQKTLSATTVAIQGSGWGWLGYNKARDMLQIATCGNQELIQSKGLEPLFTIDVWEHAYYLQYKNVRPEFVSAVFNIANWKDVQQRLAAAKA